MQNEQEWQPICRGASKTNEWSYYITHERKLGAIDSVTPQTPISITRVRVLGGPLYSDFPPIFSRDPPVFPLPLLTRSMLYTHMSPLLFFAPACAYDPTFPSPSPGLEKRPMCRHPPLPSPAPPQPHHHRV